MSVIIRLQNLPWSANALDIREYFKGLNIPEGGVHIVGGDEGDAFIAFSTDEDARLAMRKTGGLLKGIQISLLLSSRNEMQKVIETARLQAMSIQKLLTQTSEAPATTPSAPAKPVQQPPSSTSISAPPLSQNHNQVFDYPGKKIAYGNPVPEYSPVPQRQESNDKGYGDKQNEPPKPSYPNYVDYTKNIKDPYVPSGTSNIPKSDYDSYLPGLDLVQKNKQEPYRPEGYNLNMPQNEGFGSNIPQNKGFGSNVPHNEGFGLNVQQNKGFGSNVPHNEGFASNVQQHKGFGSNMPQNEGFGSNVPQNKGFGSNIPQNDGFGSNLDRNKESRFGTPLDHPAPYLPKDNSSMYSSMDRTNQQAGRTDQYGNREFDNSLNQNRMGMPPMSGQAPSMHLNQGSNFTNQQMNVQPPSNTMNMPLQSNFNHNERPSQNSSLLSGPTYDPSNIMNEVAKQFQPDSTEVDTKTNDNLTAAEKNSTVNKDRSKDNRDNKERDSRRRRSRSRSRSRSRDRDRRRRYRSRSRSRERGNRRRRSRSRDRDRYERFDRTDRSKDKDRYEKDRNYNYGSRDRYSRNSRDNDPIDNNRSTSKDKNPNSTPSQNHPPSGTPPIKSGDQFGGTLNIHPSYNTTNDPTSNTKTNFDKPPQKTTGEDDLRPTNWNDSDAKWGKEVSKWIEAKKEREQHSNSQSLDPWELGSNSPGFKDPWVKNNDSNSSFQGRENDFSMNQNRIPLNQDSSKDMPPHLRNQEYSNYRLDNNPPNFAGLAPKQDDPYPSKNEGFQNWRSGADEQPIQRDYKHDRDNVTKGDTNSTHDNYSRDVPPFRNAPMDRDNYSKRDEHSRRNFNETEDPYRRGQGRDVPPLGPGSNVNKPPLGSPNMGFRTGIPEPSRDNIPQKGQEYPPMQGSTYNRNDMPGVPYNREGFPDREASSFRHGPGTFDNNKSLPFSGQGNNNDRPPFGDKPYGRDDGTLPPFQRGGPHDREGPPTMAGPRNMDVPPMMGGPRNLDASTNMGGPRNMDAPPTRGGPRNLDAPPNMGGPRNIDVPPMMGGPRNTDAPPMMGGPRNMDAPPNMGGPRNMEVPSMRGAPRNIDGPPMMGGPRNRDGPPMMGGPRNMDGPPTRGGPRNLDAPPNMGGPRNIDGPPMMGGPRNMDVPPSMGGARNLDGPPNMGGPRSMDGPPMMGGPRNIDGAAMVRGPHNMDGPLNRGGPRSMDAPPITGGSRNMDAPPMRGDQRNMDAPTRRGEPHMDGPPMRGDRNFDRPPIRGEPFNTESHQSRGNSNEKDSSHREKPRRQSRFDRPFTGDTFDTEYAPSTRDGPLDRERGRTSMDNGARNDMPPSRHRQGSDNQDKKPLLSTPSFGPKGNDSNKFKNHHSDGEDSFNEDLEYQKLNKLMEEADAEANPKPRFGDFRDSNWSRNQDDKPFNESDRRRPDFRPPGMSHGSGFPPFNEARAQEFRPRDAIQGDNRQPPPNHPPFNDERDRGFRNQGREDHMRDRGFQDNRHLPHSGDRGNNDRFEHGPPRDFKDRQNESSDYPERKKFTHSIEIRNLPYHTSYKTIKDLLPMLYFPKDSIKFPENNGKYKSDTAFVKFRNFRDAKIAVGHSGMQLFNRQIRILYVDDEKYDKVIDKFKIEEPQTHVREQHNSVPNMQPSQNEQPPPNVQPPSNVQPPNVQSLPEQRSGPPPAQQIKPNKNVPDTNCLHLFNLPADFHEGNTAHLLDNYEVLAICIDRPQGNSNGNCYVMLKSPEAVMLASKQLHKTFVGEKCISVVPCPKHILEGAQERNKKNEKNIVPSPKRSNDDKVNEEPVKRLKVEKPVEAPVKRLKVEKPAEAPKPVEMCESKHINMLKRATMLFPKSLTMNQGNNPNPKKEETKEIKEDTTPKFQSPPKSLSTTPEPQKSDSGRKKSFTLVRPSLSSDSQSPTPENQQNNLNSTTKETKPEISRGELLTDCVVMKNVPPNATESDIRDFYSDEGLVPEIVHFNPPAGGKRTVYIMFPIIHNSKQAVGKSNQKLGPGKVIIELIPKPVVMKAIGKPFDPLELIRRMKEGNEGSPTKAPTLPEQSKRNAPGGTLPQQSQSPQNAPKEDSKSELPKHLVNRFKGRLEIKSKEPPKTTQKTSAAQNFGKEGCVISLKNVPTKATTHDILHFFKMFPYLKPSNIFRRYDDFNKPTTDARVSFPSAIEADKAVKLNNNKYMIGSQINLDVVK